MQTINEQKYNLSINVRIISIILAISLYTTLHRFIAVKISRSAHIRLPQFTAETAAVNLQGTPDYTILSLFLSFYDCHTPSWAF